MGYCDVTVNDGQTTFTQRFGVAIIGGTTGIQNVNRETITNNRYYNLAGQRVAQPTKGMYIVNGKKVIIK